MNVWIVSAHRSWGDRIEYHGHRGDTHRWMGWTRPIPKVVYGSLIRTHRDGLNRVHLVGECLGWTGDLPREVVTV